IKMRAAAENVGFQLTYLQGASAYTIQRDSKAIATKPIAEGTTITKDGVISCSPRGTAGANRVRLRSAAGVCKQVVVSATGRIRSCGPSSCAEDCWEPEHAARDFPPAGRLHVQRSPRRARPRGGDGHGLLARQRSIDSAPDGQRQFDDRDSSRTGQARRIAGAKKSRRRRSLSGRRRSRAFAQTRRGGHFRTLLADRTLAARCGTETG